MREPRTFFSDGEAETEAIGGLLAGEARPGQVIGLCGALGAGKTVLVRGVLRGLGGRPEAVHSPTFTLLNVYPGRLPVHHFDLYRLGSEDELDGIGFYEFARSGGVSLVEWADRFPGLASEVDRWVTIGFVDASDRRRIVIQDREAPV